ncbi:MAG: hypothetical protein KME64_14885 [Scytonematopsis contorta HA4267-MV1]|jgi:hypothetical protein|nr:hypothetical protein [Scytonematopsis contorta HA4267-MV1]
MHAIIFLNKLSHLNLDVVAQKLICQDFGYGWTVEKTKLEITSYKKFLYLNFLFPYKEFTPTWEIDKVWHTHILTDTYQYIQDCHSLFGYILHHRSSMKNNDNSNQNQTNSTEFTLINFEESLGLDIWESVHHTSYDIAACVTIPMNFVTCIDPTNPVYTI